MKMKKEFYLSVLAAIGLFLSACSSSEEETDPVVGGGTVKAEFTISFPQDVARTRQSEDVVQGQSTPIFRGIQNIELMPFMVQKNSISTSTTIPSTITLSGGTVGKSGSSGTQANVIAKENALYRTNNSHLYKDVDIAIGTKAFMFYGVAIDETPTSPAIANQVNGALQKVTATPATSTLADITFSPVQIRSEGTVGSNATLIADYLTAIANAKVSDNDKWSTTSVVVLRSLYNDFITIQAGSWRSVKAEVQKLYESLNERTDDLSAKIKEAITSTTYSDNSSTPKYVASISGTTLNFADLKDYPADIYLPDGAAYVSWDKNNSKFNPLVSSDGAGTNMSPLNLYVYPASLYYHVLSNILTATSSKAEDYNDQNTWETIKGKYTENLTEVTAKTRSIAVEDQIQYAVGRLDVTVRTESGSASLKDYNDNDVTIGSNFPVTAILVGNQRPVDYKFQTVTSATAYTLYDNQVPTKPESVTAGAEGDPTVYLYAGTNPNFKTHTLVLETPNASSNEDENANVPIAVEFQNNSSAIIAGKDGKLILPGTKFYMVGTLKPNMNTSQTYTTDGTEIIKKAFVQDYTTTANLVIKSFKNAYHVLPDLRMPHLELGLSVDLTWQTGITQEIVID